MHANTKLLIVNYKNFVESGFLLEYFLNHHSEEAKSIEFLIKTRATGTYVTFQI